MTLKTFIFKSGQKKHARVSSKGKLFYAGKSFSKIDNPTCQICGRQIKSNTGVIAHHGYQRPGGGWQTASCNGARGLPYEVSCDLLPPTIKKIEDYIDFQKKRLKDFINNPPDTLTVSFGSSWRKEQKLVNKPAGFNPEVETIESSRLYTYENEFEHQKHIIEREIKFSKLDLEFMKKRLADWKPPKNHNPFPDPEEMGKLRQEFGSALDSKFKNSREPYTTRHIKPKGK